MSIRFLKVPVDCEDETCQPCRKFEYVRCGADGWGYVGTPEQT